MSAPARETMRRGWCPGTLRPMLTGDGLLVRLHPPHNALTPDQLARVAELAARHGNGQIEISGRGNLQLRGIRAEAHAALVDDLLAAGLVDEADGDGPNRLTLTSPLAGRAADELIDAAVLAEAVERAGRGVAGLPAKLSIVVDGGGALALDSFAVDLRLRVVTAEAVAFGLPGDLWFAPVARDEVPVLTAQLLGGFVTVSRRSPDQIRRMRDLDPEGLATLATSCGLVPMAAPAARPKPITIGLVAERDSQFALLAGLPFGRTGTDGLVRLGTLASDAGVREIRLSPWRGFAFCGLRPDAAGVLQAALRSEGLVVEPDDPRLSVSACTGAPACTRGEAPALAGAAALADALSPLLAHGLSLHVSGCAKSCAHPGSADLTLVGAGGRYDVIVAGGANDAAMARLSLRELVRRLEPGQDIRARLDAAHTGGRQVPSLNTRHAYIRDGAAIYERSFAIIRTESDLSRFSGTAERVVVRMIHACGMTDLPKDVAMSPDFADVAAAALAQGAPILCDARMVADGVTRTRLPAKNEVICTLPESSVPKLAEEMGTTRSAAAMEPGGRISPVRSSSSAMRRLRCSACSTCSTKACQSRPL